MTSPPELRLVDGNIRGAARVVLLAHGAGAAMDSPFLQQLAAQLVAGGGPLGGIAVVRFNFPYMQQRASGGGKRPPDRQPVLLESFRREIARLEAEGVTRQQLVIGGKSMGGRMASLIADGEGVAALLCLGYPFHPPGKPEKLRTEHLQGLITPCLICQGERDTFGRRDEVVGYPLAAAIRLAWLEDGDHSFKPRQASGQSEAGNMAMACRAILDFLAALPPP